MNRVQSASHGFTEMVKETPVGWVTVGFMFVVAFFLIGHLVSVNYRRAKIKRRKRQRQQEKARMEGRSLGRGRQSRRL